MGKLSGVSRKRIAELLGKHCLNVKRRRRFVPTTAAKWTGFASQLFTIPLLKNTLLKVSK
jgi:hypothetical protein